MTWYGQQGLQSEPNKIFLVDGKNMGNWGAEVGEALFDHHIYSCVSRLTFFYRCVRRDLSYHHILGVGHVVPYVQPAVVFALVRDLVIGNARYQH